MKQQQDTGKGAPSNAPDDNDMLVLSLAGQADVTRAAPLVTTFGGPAAAARAAADAAVRTPRGRTAAPSATATANDDPFGAFARPAPAKDSTPLGSGTQIKAAIMEKLTKIHAPPAAEAIELPPVLVNLMQNAASALERLERTAARLARESDRHRRRHRHRSRSPRRDRDRHRSPRRDRNLDRYSRSRSPRRDRDLDRYSRSPRRDRDLDRYSRSRSPRRGRGGKEDVRAREDAENIVSSDEATSVAAAAPAGRSRCGTYSSMDRRHRLEDDYYRRHHHHRGSGRSHSRSYDRHEGRGQRGDWHRADGAPAGVPEPPEGTQAWMPSTEALDAAAAAYFAADD